MKSSRIAWLQVLASVCERNQLPDYKGSNRGIASSNKESEK